MVKFSDEPGDDPDGDDLTYIFRGEFTAETPEALTEGRLKVTRKGNNFEIEASEETNPAQFAAIYGDEQSAEIAFTIAAHDGNTESEPQSFSITFYYDASAYFDDADRRGTDNRFTFNDPLETYEGPAAGHNLTINWSAHIAGARAWGTNISAKTITCRDNANNAVDHAWPAGGTQDGAQFDAPPASTSGKSGAIPIRFTNAPDYENPADANDDNTYLVRFQNTHTLHNPTSDSKIPSCPASALELAVKVKDVGTPAPVMATAAFRRRRRHENRRVVERPDRVPRERPSGAVPSREFQHVKVPGADPRRGRNRLGRCRNRHHGRHPHFRRTDRGRLSRSGSRRELRRSVGLAQRPPHGRSASTATRPAQHAHGPRPTAG